jgi:hypothetical protein
MNPMTPQVNFVEQKYIMQPTFDTRVDRKLFSLSAMNVDYQKFNIILTVQKEWTESDFCSFLWIFMTLRSEGPVCPDMGQIH